MAKAETQYDVMVIDKKTKLVKRKLGPYGLEAAQKAAASKDIDTTLYRTAIAVSEPRPGEVIPIDPDYKQTKEDKEAVSAALKRKGKSRGRKED